jgi:hypothetical protein
VRTDDHEVALLLAHAAHQIDEVLWKVGRHRSRRSTRPGIPARVYLGIARPENAHCRRVKVQTSAMRSSTVDVSRLSVSASSRRPTFRIGQPARARLRSSKLLTKPRLARQP